MSISEIQEAVAELSSKERKRLTAWILTRYPMLSVEELLESARALVKEGWTPDPPTDDNRLSDRGIEHARDTAKRLGLDGA